MNENTTAFRLDTLSLRVLGALMEKEMTTPDAYPLSINAIEAAANQRSSRDPVMNLTEEDVRFGLDTLEANDLVALARGSRVPRYEHRIRTVLTLRRDETAVVCLMLLRGPQTAGELRNRSDRMFPFDDLAAVQAALDRLAARTIPLVLSLPRAAGSREVRWTHLLGDQAIPQTSHPATETEAFADAGMQAQLDQLREQLTQLQQRVAYLEAAAPPDKSKDPAARSTETHDL